MTPTQALRRYFNHQEFRPGQADIVASILTGHDTLAILPTGGGKSVCFQVPALLMPGLTIIISPLIALMKDQVDHLNAQEPLAVALHSGLEPKEMADAIDQLKQKKISLVYVSPERLLTPAFKELIDQLEVSLIVIDEAHCIAEWGHDFRPAYQNLPKFLAQLPKRPTVAAFTATATPAVRREIQTLLQLRAPRIFLHSFHRPNLALAAKACLNRDEQMIYVLRLVNRHRGQAGIIYVTSRAGTEELAELLTHFGYPAVAYHAGLAEKTKTEIQDAFVHKKIHLITATTAFGMGIDRSDIRFVIHANYPASIEGYYQEIGRAGRDGEMGRCYLLCTPRDFQLQKRLQLKTDPTKKVHKPKSDQRRRLTRLQTVQRYLFTDVCRTKHVLGYFGEKFSRICNHCDRCASPPWSRSADELKHYKLLENVKQTLAKQRRLHAHFILPPAIQAYWAVLWPKTIEDVQRLPGIGQGWQKQWGGPIWDLLTKRQGDAFEGAPS